MAKAWRSASMFACVLYSYGDQTESPYIFNKIMTWPTWIGLVGNEVAWVDSENNRQLLSKLRVSPIEFDYLI